MVSASAGDLGDCIYLLGVLAELKDGPHSVLLMPSPETKFKTWDEINQLSRMVAPLAAAQPYISECRVAKPEDQIEWRSQDFRGKGIWCPRATLLEAKAFHLQQTRNKGFGIRGNSKWLTAEPDWRAKNRIVINRTGRYRNGYFPWDEIVRHYGDRLLFLGLPHEYRDFSGEFGLVDWIRTDDMLQAARLVEASSLVIANQSCINALAEGLKHCLIQEASLNIPDCIWKRGNAQHVYDGYCVLPDIDGSGEYRCRGRFKEAVNPNRHRTPPGLWQYDGMTHNPSLAGLVDAVYLKERRARPKEDIELDVLAHNIRRLPDYFMDKSSRCIFDTFHEAHRNAP